MWTRKTSSSLRSGESRHYKEILREAEKGARMYAMRQIREGDRLHVGGVMDDRGLPEPKAAAFAMAGAIALYLNPDSSFHGDAGLADRIRLTLDYLERVRRPGGCFDFLDCNFSSAPDTSFMMNRVVVSWELLEKCGGKAEEWLRNGLATLLERSADGVRAGGFHTPNHRWAIASFLTSCARITGREELAARAGEYLTEGIDCDENGEYSERSTGDYNLVNNDQMIRLYLETGRNEYLGNAARNLAMMLSYFDPDGSVFTGNSTRQDRGRKVFPQGYYLQYLLVGHLTGRRAFGAVAEWIYGACSRRGIVPDCLDWLMLFPEMDGFAADDALPHEALDYSAFFPRSGIARTRRGSHSFTLLEKNGRFLHFQSGEISACLRIGASLCEHRAFIAERIEKTENGFRLKSVAHGWYYLPFKEKPSTTDWWAMDNASRRKIHGPDLEIVVEVKESTDGIEVEIAASGVDRLPLRVEIGVTAGCVVKTPHFTSEGTAGEAVIVKDGVVEISRGTDRVTVGPGFAEHSFIGGKFGSEARAAGLYTLYFTAFTPVRRTIAIRSM